MYIHIGCYSECEDSGMTLQSVRPLYPDSLSIDHWGSNAHLAGEFLCFVS